MRRWRFFRNSKLKFANLSPKTLRHPRYNRETIIGSLLQRVSGTSIQEIENLIAELQILRGNLQNEAARVQRELVGYAVLIQDAKKSISTISESLSFRRNDHMPARTAIAK
jgi:hypothetical protein